MTLAETLSLLLFGGVCAGLMAGFPVAFTLGGVSLIFGLLANFLGVFDLSFFGFIPNRIFGIMTNEVLLAVPLFVFMGVMLERSKVADDLLNTMGGLFGTMRGGLGISVCVVGALLAASTGIVGATVVTMGLLSLPTMLRWGYDPKLACGTICASGTLGQIIPPSIVLVVLGDQISNAYQDAQRSLGNFAPDPVSVGDLFAGAGKTIGALVVPVVLIIAVLGSILAGIATPTEAAAVGAIGATLLGGMRLANGGQQTLMLVGGLALIGMLILTGTLDLRLGRDSVTGAEQFGIYAAAGCCLLLGLGLLDALRRTHVEGSLREVMQQTTKISAMVFGIVIGAQLFSLVFRGLGGDDIVHEFLSSMPGGAFGAMLVVMLTMFVMGFFLDFIEISFVVIPIVAPILLMMDINPVWLGIMIAVNLQTSFLTPPFGFALFYLRGVAPPSISTMQIYKGVIPFVLLQLLMLAILWVFPDLTLWLPRLVYGTVAGDG